MGYFRFILALVVCSNHLSLIGGAGRFAVFSFYILSGFLMTTILNKRYGLTASGISKYAINRFLRIYPTYLIVFLISVGSIYLFGNDNIKSLDPNLSIPVDTISWLKNISLMGMNFFVQERSVPPAWTLFVEVMFYLVIPIVMTAGKKAIWAWFIVSVIYHVVIISNNAYPVFAWNERYGTVFAGSLGFSVGCLLSTYQDKMIIGKITGVISFIGLAVIHLSVMSMFIFGFSIKDQFLISIVLYYLNMIISAALVLFLFRMKESSISRKLGEFSYPLYLFHIPGAFITYHITGFQIKSLLLFITSMVFSILICYVLVTMEVKINLLRNSIKNL